MITLDTTLIRNINYKRIIFLFIISALLILGSNAVIQGGLYRIYGVPGHSIVCAMLMTLYLYLNKDGTRLFLITYLGIVVPIVLMALSLNTTIFDYKLINRIIAESTLSSMELSIVISSFALFVRRLKSSVCKKILVHIVCLIWMILIAQFVIVVGYAINYGSGPSGAAVYAIIQTNISETYEYILSQGWLIRITYFGFALLSPVIYYTLYKVQTKDSSLNSNKPAAVITLIILTIIGNANIRLEVVYSSYIAAYLTWHQQHTFKNSMQLRVDQLKTLQLDNKESEDGLFVVVVGESHARHRMSAYGYEKETTPWLNKQIGKDNFFVFHNPYSCHVLTAQALPMVLTSMSLYDEQQKSLNECPSITEVANAYGFEVSWISNQPQFGFGDLPQTVVASVAKNQYWMNKNDNDFDFRSEFFDEVVLSGLKEVIQSTAKKKLVFIHIMGSHANYAYRYPADFQRWTNDDSEDTYDNSVLYNDDLLKRIYEIVSKNESFSAMMYFADHGEQVGSGHNPDEFTYNMSRIPFWIAVSDSYAKRRTDVINSVSSNIEKAFSNDTVFDLVCGLTGMTSHPYYKARLDISSPEFNIDPESIKVFRVHKITEDPLFNKLPPVIHE